MRYTIDAIIPKADEELYNVKEVSLTSWFFSQTL